MSAHTQRIGLGATYSTSYFPPFHVARAFATLDHLSGGRALWNVVTSLNTNEAENMGGDHSISSDRYDRADEFMEITTQLRGELGGRRARPGQGQAMFADPAKAHEINFNGRSLRSRGPRRSPVRPRAGR